MDTTTDVATQEEAPITAQPPVEQPAEADTPVSEPPTPDAPDGEEEPDEPAPTDTSDDLDELSDEQVLEWAAKKGLDLSTPEGQAKALRSFRTAEKKMHQATTQASELANKVSGDGVDPNATEAQRALHIATQLQNAQIIKTWAAANNVSAEEDLAMGKYAQDNPDTAALLREGESPWTSSVRWPAQRHASTKPRSKRRARRKLWSQSQPSRARVRSLVQRLVLSRQPRSTRSKLLGMKKKTNTEIPFHGSKLCTISPGHH